MLTFQPEHFSDVIAELDTLLPGQWHELGTHRTEIKLDRDVENYARMDAAGGVKITTARDGSRLVGWYINFLVFHPHYKTALYAFHDVDYLLPEYRKGTNGLRLLMAMENQMRSLGVKVITSVSKKTYPRMPVFEFLGWEEQGTVVMKVLE